MKLAFEKKKQKVVYTLSLKPFWTITINNNPYAEHEYTVRISVNDKEEVYWKTYNWFIKDYERPISLKEIEERTLEDLKNICADTIKQIGKVEVE